MNTDPIQTETALIERIARQPSYWVPAMRDETEIEIKHSRFITTGVHARDEQDLHALVAQMRARFPNANHHCSAHVLGMPTQPIAAGSSDDGEPSGTAGKPILNQLLSANIGETAVVVTRFFGGIKLGAGGLIRAYGASVRSLLDQWQLEARTPTLQFRISYDYAQTAVVEALIARFSAVVLDSAYGAAIEQSIQVSADQGLECRDALLQLAYKGVSYTLLSE